MDWRMVGVLFSFCQFVFVAIIFSVLKFNDLKHLDEDMRDLKKSFHAHELKDDERHTDNIKAMGQISITVSNLAGKMEALNK